jgi:glycosyltransferase involved in cell wall biosynthesis
VPPRALEGITSMRHLLVDARPLTHPTAGGRGIGNHVAGLLEGLATIGAPITALVASDDARSLVPADVSTDAVEVLSREAVRRHAEQGTWFLATSMYLHPVSLDPIPAAVTDARLPVAALLYDVIPYRYPAHYLVEDDPARQARLRAVWARTVDVHCANSAFVARTAVEELGLDASRIRVTGAAAAGRFRPARPGAPAAIDGPYVVTVTSGDERKNTHGLLHGWALVPDDVRRTTRLVVVATPSGTVTSTWQRLASDLGVDGSVDFRVGLGDDEVVNLLQHARLGVVPSTEEGFGLAVLEIAACGPPVVCAGVTSLPEVLPDTAAHFDPSDPADIARAIVRGLRDDSHRGRLRTAAAGALRRWRWDRVAADVVAAIDGLGPHENIAIRAPRHRDVTAVVAALDGPRVPFSETVVPASAIGRYVKRHDLDRVTFVDADGGQLGRGGG